MNKFLPAIARVFIAQIFLISIILSLTGILNIVGGYMAYQNGLMSHGLPGIFAPISVVVQLIVGFTLLIGFKTRISAIILTIYTLINALSYLYTFTIVPAPLNLLPLQQAMQYLAITGGLIMLMQNPVTTFAFDNRAKTKKQK
ncbi:MAG: DoxX family protein [Candidatus Methylopumilus sp.]|nr:DoxX family protein [Candidatus Methylopumilus sp.]